MIRVADGADAVTLFVMEKAASSTALTHVFSGVPFPDDDVISRWRLVLDDPSATVLVDEEAGEPVGYAAYGDGWLRHLGVVPGRWRAGRGRALHDAVIRKSTADGATVSKLWVLVDNHRALAFYASLGWKATGQREPEVFAPYPLKMVMTRA
ncbi:MAG: GNAT family N-acetyltransferase [Propionibacteriales bacterium]|nr:GNAT family N-acetyltransferase [Propionibacteriales bacterium]